MSNKMSKEAALDKMYDFILLLKSQPTHHSIATSHDDTILALEQLNNIFNN